VVYTLDEILPKFGSKDLDLQADGIYCCADGLVCSLIGFPVAGSGGWFCWLRDVDCGLSETLLELLCAGGPACFLVGLPVAGSDW